jgi:hypothetical protein
VNDHPIYEQSYEAAPGAQTKRSPSGGTLSIIPTPYVWQDPSHIPPRPWVLGRWLLRSTVAAVVAPGGVGKSSLMATALLSLATGRPLLGKTVWGGPLRAWYWNLEDDRDELHRQIAAAVIQHNVDPAQLADRMWIDSGPDGQGLCTAVEDEGGFRVLEPVYEALHEALTSRGIDVLIVDPFVSSHGADENSNTRIDAIAKAWARVATHANCVIVLVHHSRKLGGQKVTAELSRGAVALTNAARITLVLNRMDSDEGSRFGITEEAERRRYFSVQDDKHNRAPAEHANWFRFASVDLGNGTASEPSDSVGAVEPWTPPDPFDGLTGQHLYQVQLAIDAGEWRESSQVKDGSWVGVPVARTLGLNAEDPSHKARIKRLLHTWLNEGVLRVERRKDHNHELRPFVIVGRWQNDPTPPAPPSGAVRDSAGVG